MPEGDALNINGANVHVSKTRYIIIGYPRSGTTIIHLAVMGHPNVTALTDEMKIVPFFTRGISIFTFGNDTREEKERGYRALFDALTLLKEKEDTRAHGLKVVCPSPERARALVHVLQRYIDDIKVILILRRDLVAQLGSELHAKKTGVYHSWYGRFQDMKPKKIKIYKFEFIGYASSVFETHHELKRLEETHHVLDIHYEDLLAHQSEVFEKIYAFLNIPALEPTWLDSKKVLPPPEEYITNYRDMRLVLADLEKRAIPQYCVSISKTSLKLYKLFRYLGTRLKR
ncbi:MAG: hypothetical protein Kow0099_36450 [Candidatus Abyssubacteria bacterium]